jgi:hypothetical protein
MEIPETTSLLIFIREYLGSVWAVKLMQALLEEPTRAWTPNELVHHLRASHLIVDSILRRFQRVGLAMEVEPGKWEWQPIAHELNIMAKQIAEAYVTRPVAITTLIANHSPSNVHLLADVFQIWKK